MRLRTLIRQQFRRLGLDVSRFNAPGSFTYRRARLLTEHGVDLVLDVGASDGGFAGAVRAAGYTGHIWSFEPLEAPFRAMASKARRDPQWEVHQLALGEVPATQPMNVALDDKCSSLLSPLERHTRAYPNAATSQTRHVKVVRLDDWMASNSGSVSSFFLKIDTQGYEDRVLAGATGTLDRVVGAQLELSLVPLYDEGPKYHNLMRFMDERGFALVAVEPAFAEAKSGHTLQIDALFLREA